MISGTAAAITVTRSRCTSANTSSTLAAGREHDGAAVVEGAQHAGRGQVVVVPERQDRQQHRAVGEARRGAAQARVEHVVVVRARNQLGQRRGAARQQHRRHVGRPRSRRRRRCRGQVGERALAGARLAGYQHVPQGREFALHLACHRTVVEPADHVGNEVGDRAGCAQEVPHFGLPVRAQRRHRHRADHVEREIADDELDRVRQLHEHQVAALEAEAGQARRAVLAAREQFRVGETLLSVDQRDLVRYAPRGAREHPADGHALPQSRGAVARGDVLRPADEAFHGVHLPCAATSGCSAS